MTPPPTQNRTPCKIHIISGNKWWDSRLSFLLCLYHIVVKQLNRFPPNQQIFLHRHLALTNTLVVQGEHRMYEPNGALKEVRPVGSYTSTPPGEPHREGAGDEGGVVFYSVRGKDGVLFEILDDDLHVVGTLSMQDFLNAFKEQKNA